MNIPRSLSDAPSPDSAFPGVTAWQPGIRFLLSTAEEQILTLRRVGPSGRRFLKAYGVEVQRRLLFRAAKKLRHVEALSKKFLIVKRSPSEKRKVKAQGGAVVDVPLVFSSTLPLRPQVTIVVEDKWNSVRVIAQAPAPTQEAARAIKLHGSKFDHLEVWWIPNDVLVEPLPEPDPMLVGYVGIPGRREGYYFQLHRWIDETVESPWFAKEGY